MTTVAVILIGAGSLLMLSALDNVSLIDEFKQILSGDHASTQKKAGDKSFGGGGSSAK